MPPESRDDRAKRLLEAQLKVQRAVHRFKEVLDEAYGRQHTWNVSVVVRADQVEYWRVEVTHKPIADPAA